MPNTSRNWKLQRYTSQYDELKKSPNTQLYKELLDKVGDKLGPTYAKDQGWVDSVDKKAQQQVERLELELNGYKTNLVKESIRVSVSAT